jgi:crossover junction endodeoxyribonuclease RuvC
MGVDPGLAATGFGLIEMGSGGTILYRGSGVIRAPSTLSFPQRIQRIYRRLAEEIKNYTPHLMAVEQPFFAKNVKSAMLLGQARGLAILAAAEAGVEVHEYSPLEVKQAVVGYGRAAKEQVQAMISSLLQVPQNLKADAADALAVAICLAHSYSWKKSMRLLTVPPSPAGPRGRRRNEDRVEGRG